MPAAAGDALAAALQRPAFTTVAADAMGPPLWASIHNIARAYEPTPEKQAAVRAFLQSLAVLLPCSVCAQHFAALAPTARLGSAYDLLKWTVDTHNAVNARLHKPTLSDAQAVLAMEKNGAGASVGDSCKTPTWAWTAPATVLAIVAAVLLIALAVVLAAPRGTRHGTP